MFSEEIHNLLLEKFKEERFLDCFLIDLEMKGKLVQIFIDADSTFSYDRCQEISRYVENFLDNKNYLNGDFTLEVSSPGIGRPLKFPRQFKKNVGRSIHVKYNTDQKQEGKLISSTDDHIIIEWEEIRKEGKKKIKEIKNKKIEYSLIHEAKIQIKI